MTDRERLILTRVALALDAGHAEHRLAWLRTLLDELNTSEWAFAQPDPLAAHEALYECRTLVSGLEIVFRDELDALLERERAALGEVPGPDDEELPL